MSERNATPDDPHAVRFGRRFAALIIDNLVAAATVAATFGLESRPGIATFIPLGVFWLEVTVLTGLLGFTIGKRVMGLRVINVDGRPIGLGPAAVRSALLCLILPAIVQNADGRGLHDLAAGSKVVRA